MIFRTSLLALAVCVLSAGLAQAQAPPGFSRTQQFHIDQPEKDHWRLTGAVEMERDNWKMYAEVVDYYTETDKLVAVDNVVFTSEGHRIAADRVEFNTKTRTGTFYNAAGTAALGDRVNKSMFGTQEPDAYFYGETIEKLGPTKYRITRGGFTTCVQPTPRWAMTSQSVTVNLDHYAFLRNAILRVKGVPLFYMPAFYYPIQEDDRATGFLIPMYGTSTYRGQTISNAFFWAINRSHDATIMHDWFSKTGQGFGGEYRYIQGPGSEGNARTYFLNEHALELPGGAVQAGRRSYQIQGGGSQVITRAVRARGNVDYFSDIAVQQLYHQNIYDASNRRRTYGANVTGAFGRGNTISSTFQRNEVFYGRTGSTVTGGTPRINFSQSERPIPNLPIYYSVSAEYQNLLRRGKTGTQEVDTGLTRYDVSPLVRVPFTRWPFLTVNSSVGWHTTHWSESIDPTIADAQFRQVDVGVSRRYFDLTSQITGPVFNRIFNTPDNGYADKFKHVIEPSVTFQRVTSVDNYVNIPQLDSLDAVIGGSTRVAYGLSNRLYAKRKPAGGGPGGVSREIVNVGLVQSYYTDARAAQVDRQYRTSFTSGTGAAGVRPTHFSPVAITARISPMDELNVSLRGEYDTQFDALRSIQANGTYARGGWLQTTAGWSQTRFVKELPGFNDRTRLAHSLNSATTISTTNNRIGGVYTFNYDLLRDSFLQWRMVGYYNAQCCGIAVEYQSFNFRVFAPTLKTPQDRRFNVSFTLAGIGSFSNFFGALGGAGTSQR